MYKVQVTFPRWPPHPYNAKKKNKKKKNNTNFLCDSQVKRRCPWATCERSSPLKLLRQSKTKSLDRENQKLYTVSRKTSCQDKPLKFSSEPYYKLYRLQSRHLRLIGIIYVYRKKNKAGWVVCLFELMLCVPVNS